MNNRIKEICEELIGWVELYKSNKIEVIDFCNKCAPLYDEMAFLQMDKYNEIENLQAQTSKNLEKTEEHINILKNAEELYHKSSSNYDKITDYILEKGLYEEYLEYERMTDQDHEVKERRSQFKIIN